MAEMNRLSEGLIDAAERFADVVDAAQGNGARKGGHVARWLILPAASATAVALVTSGSGVARETRKLLGRAKDRATDLPDADLFGRVQELTGRGSQSPSTNGQSRRTRSSTRRRRTTSRSAARRTSSATS
jgi:hypothetical protein